jgi:hypothetical protein
MKKKVIEKVNPETVPEVLEFMDAQQAIAEFKQEHKKVFEEFTHLVDRYNTSLEQASKVVRAQQVECGPFAVHNTSVKYDAEALYLALGHDLFLEVGGILSTKMVKDIDKGRFEAAITAPNSKITDEVVKAVRKEGVAYRTIEKLVAP